MSAPEDPMSSGAFSLRIFSIYLFALGSLLVLAPDVLLGLFGIEPPREVWIRVVGTLVLAIGYFYFMASRHEVIAFFRWTIPARLAVASCLLAFVTVGWAPPVLLLFGAIDALAALWTALCLRRMK